MRLRIATLVAVLCAALVGCGGGAVNTAGRSAAASSAAGSAAASALATTPLTERDFRFDTPELSVRAGSTIQVTNAGPTVHNVAIRDASGSVRTTTDDLKPGTQAGLQVTVPPGTYTIICTLPGHESLGLKGTLTVTP